MAATYTGTTHNSGNGGNGPTISKRRFAWPSGLPRGAPARGKTAPWYLTRRHLSRPKRRVYDGTTVYAA